MSEDIDDRYRHESASDPSRPRDSVRQAVLAHAARVAADTRRSQSIRHRRRGVFGLLAAAALAGLLVIPRFSKPPGPAVARVYAPEPAAAPAPAAERTAGRAPAPAAAAERAAGPAGVPASAAAPTPAQTTAAAPASPVPAPARAHSESLDHALPKSREAAEYQAAMRAQSAVAPSAPSSAAGASSPALDEASAGAYSRAPVAGLARDHAAAESRQAMTMGAAPAIDPGPALRAAAATGDVTTMNALIGRGADINARDANGRTALMLAVLGQQDAAVDALLARGADANAADAGGIRPLQAAVAAGRSKIASALRRAGAR